jgi:hypothetical protein
MGRARKSSNKSEPASDTDTRSAPRKQRRRRELSQSPDSESADYERELCPKKLEMKSYQTNWSRLRPDQLVWVLANEAIGLTAQCLENCGKQVVDTQKVVLTAAIIDGASVTVPPQLTDQYKNRLLDVALEMTTKGRSFLISNWDTLGEVKENVQALVRKSFRKQKFTAQSLKAVLKAKFDEAEAERTKVERSRPPRPPTNFTLQDHVFVNRGPRE